MGLFDKRRLRAQQARNGERAHEQLSPLYNSRALRRTSPEVKDWLRANSLLRDTRARENAGQNLRDARLLVRYLEVPEPHPALEDFLPEDAAAAYETALVRGPQWVLEEAQRRFEAGQNAYAHREQLRLNELEAARLWQAECQRQSDAREVEHQERLKAQEARMIERRNLLKAQAAERKAIQAQAQEERKAKEAERQKKRKAKQAERQKQLRAEALKWQLSRWPDGVKLDARVAAIRGITEQVDAQNEKIERQVRSLKGLLAQGLAGLASPNPILVAAAASDDDVARSSIAEDIEHALTAVTLPVEFKPKVRAAYMPQSRQAVVEYELPDLTIVPHAKHFRYVQSRERVIETPRPASQSKSLYGDTISQLALLCLAHVFATDQKAVIDVVVFNGVLEAVDPRSGQRIRPCLITVRVTRDTFGGLDLTQVDPQACLKHLSAAVSKSPTELTPVRPVLEFSMVDARFIAANDAMSSMDTRPNLMDLTPVEFEGLIQNLFTKMGLETKQTRASRDGGVDCVAYDTRPIFGGKVVIQAKRYKNTVGVSAVRDLFGTLQNEGASKGILVTTSGYGQASFEFANNKPIELLEGTHLLYLLETHAGIKARIEPPDDWRDPAPDQGEIRGDE